MSDDDLSAHRPQPDDRRTPDRQRDDWQREERYPDERLPEERSEGGPRPRTASAPWERNLGPRERPGMTANDPHGGPPPRIPQVSRPQMPQGRRIGPSTGPMPPPSRPFPAQHDAAAPSGAPGSFDGQRGPGQAGPAQAGRPGAAPARPGPAGQRGVAQPGQGGPGQPPPAQAGGPRHAQAPEYRPVPRPGGPATPAQHPGQATYPPAQDASRPGLAQPTRIPPRRPGDPSPQAGRPVPTPAHGARPVVPPPERTSRPQRTPESVAAGGVPERPAPSRFVPPPRPRDNRPSTEEWEVEPEQPQEDAKKSAAARLLRDSGSIAVATLVSRITGFAKVLMLAAVLGPEIASAFTSASLIPNMIAELVLGAVLTAIVVPTLVRAEQEDFDGGRAFVRRLVTAAFTVLATATTLTLIATPILATRVFVDSDGQVNTALTTALTFLLVPAILFYGMSALFTAVLNTRQNFKPGAWAPVLNNVVALTVLAIYALTPGEITLDPVRMSDPKLLVLGVGTTLGVVTQAMVLLPAIRREGIDLRPLWGLDDRLKQFGTMGAAIILYVLISQIGLIFTNNIASKSDEAGPAIYSYTWLLLQLPYGVLGVTLLTAIMPRLSRNAAADDTPAVVDDLSVATRLTMIALLPVVTFFTLAGTQVGEALFGYARFAGDASRLGDALAWSAFSLIPYSLVLIHLRVFYAREQAWTPTWIILGITGVKITLSALAPHIASSPDKIVLVLGVVNGVSFGVGAAIGGYLLHRSLGDLRMVNVGRTITRVLLSSVAAGAVMWIVDIVLGLNRLSESWGGPGSLIRVAIDGIVLFAVAFGLMRLAGIPEVVAITVAISRRLGITPPAPDLDLDGPVDEEHATQILRRPERYIYTGFDPVMDAQTMVLPVIRPEAVDPTVRVPFPYPVRQKGTSGEPALSAFDEETVKLGEGGTRVSDDAAVGGVPAAGSSAPPTAGLSTDRSPAAGEPSGPESAQQHQPAPGQRDDRHQAPPRDPMYDTGMIPIPPRQMPPPVDDETTKRVQRGPKLIPGASVAGGRYRLLASHGGARGLKFWQALDIKLDREVALTFVDADQKAAENSGHDGPQAILSRTLRLGRINSPGLARVLDVVRGSSGGIVVAEWTPGRSLREMAETVPSPIGAARAIRALASAAELAHRGGGALSIDHPDRVRISASGDAVLAFPGTLADADAQSDVRGLGAMLYALITARWPLRTGGVAGNAATIGGLRLADLGPDGSPIEPRQIRPEVPFEISAVAVRSLESDKGVRTAATVQHVLEQASVVDQKTDFIPVLRLGQRQQPLTDHSLADPELLAQERERSQRMLWVMIGLGVLAALVVGVVIWWMVSIFAPGSTDAPLDEQGNIGLTTENAAAPAPESPGAVPNNPAASGVPVPVAEVGVFSPQGTPDGVNSVNAVLDDDPATVWRTDQYFQQFPALKKGVGLIATLPSPAKLTNVSIVSPTPGTAVEIRTAPTNSPTLDQTQLIGSAVLSDGITRIAVDAGQSARYVLVWITGLGNEGSQFQSSIADLRFDAAP